MTYHDFASQLASTAPSRTALVATGLDDASAEEQINQYHIYPRANQLEIEFPACDEVIDLISNYDISNLEIGMVDFLPLPVNYGDYLHFAKVELDLMLLSINGEVLVVDWQQFDHVMWRCAVNGKQFLEAMIIISQFQTLTMLDDDIYNDETLTLSVAASAANAAGSTDYLSFYQMLLGV